MRKLIPVVAFLLAFAFAAWAQSPAQNWQNVKLLTPGTTVRISLGARTAGGDVQNVTDDALTVVFGNGQATFTRQEVTRVSIKRQSHRGRNTLIGLGAGAALGLVVGAASYTPCTGWCFFGPSSRGAAAAAGAVGIGALGTLAGALIPTGGWHEIYKQ